MNTNLTQRSKRRLAFVGTVAVLGATSLAAILGRAGAEDTYSMAPPVSGYRIQEGDLSSDGAPPDAQTTPAPASPASTVFNWKEVPQNQRVPVNRAVFDQGGYQIYDTVGETILVPFAGDNLYVMKFAVSQDGTMYFENTDSAPVLYVPQNGYLENATVPGAKWFPFTPDFQPSDPVYLGVAPDWSDYVDTGWYPNMCCYGGYYSNVPYGDFVPTIGFSIAFGGRSFFGWDAYCNFVAGDPAPFFIGFYDSGIYGFGGRHYWGGREFHGGYGYAGARFGGSFGYDGGRTFRGSEGGEYRSYFQRGNSGYDGARAFRSGGYDFRSNDRGGSNNGGFRRDDFGSGFRSRGGYSGGGFRSGGNFHGGRFSGGGFSGGHSGHR